MKKRILLVEDNATDEKLTKLTLRQSGVDVDIDVARDGAHALDALLGDGAHLPALVLLDLKLPRIDGLDVLERIRSNERTKLLPVVVLTSSREEEDVVRSYELRANAYVRKPVEFEQLVATCKTLGVFWLCMNEPLPSGER